MLIKKKTTEAMPTFSASVNYLGMDANLIKQFQKLATALNTMDDFKLPRSVAEFVRYLVMSTDARELIHFAFLHNQRALYSTLREFIRLHIDKPSIPQNVKAQFLEIASQFSDPGLLYLSRAERHVAPRQQVVVLPRARFGSSLQAVSGAQRSGRESESAGNRSSSI